MVQKETLQKEHFTYHIDTVEESDLDRGTVSVTLFEEGNDKACVFAPIVITDLFEDNLAEIQNNLRWLCTSYSHMHKTFEQLADEVDEMLDFYAD